MKIQESAEMYLETIHVLQDELGTVRAVDIARKMGFSKPSVSVTVHALEDEGYINIAEDGSITLLQAGLEIAQRIYERHTVIGQILESIGVNHETAYADACKIEHDISPETFECLKNWFKK